MAEKQKTEEDVFKKLAEAPVSGPYDEHNRSTPRSSLVALVLAVKEKDYERAANHLDLRNLPFSLDDEINGPDLVKKLVIVAKRALTIDFEDLSDDPLGHKDDGLPSYRDRITTVKTKTGSVDILLLSAPLPDSLSFFSPLNAVKSSLNSEITRFSSSVKKSLFAFPS